MNSGIEISGFDDLENLIQDMTLTDTDERKAMQEAIKVVYDATQESTPTRSETLRKSEVMQVKKEDFAVVGIVKYGVFWDIFNEFGTSKSKAHVGFFERAVNSSNDEAINVLARELLYRVK
ncbi:hypothetical protein KYB31_03985 [Clostridium felsineum]|uniref:HK97-gp10 family putative phage morphogenesis protein n=1 Tax=Clostridium felsineum TaxID=36839 RepID=UPI00214D2190|nr:HK97-gp10 family putative phage morphogenesis protein [Clostridium felsineum]MCR3758157.1 hypothetical protein [Clostridium felsineum]